MQVKRGDQTAASDMDILGWVDCRDNGESFVVLGGSDRSKHVPTMSDADEVKQHYQVICHLASRDDPSSSPVHA